jgi:hypothetical protein
VLHRGDGLPGKQLGKQPHHHLAVLEHVRDAGRHPQVVLQHAEAAVAGPHHVDAGDVRVDAGGHIDALHLRAVLRVAEDQLGRHHARRQDALVVVDVVDEGVQRQRPLAQAALEHRPLRRGQDARHDVEGNQPLGLLGVAGDGEGDAQAVEQQGRLLALAGDAVGRLGAQPVPVGAAVRPGGPGRGQHLVVGSGRVGRRGVRHGRSPPG